MLRTLPVEILNPLIRTLFILKLKVLNCFFKLIKFKKAIHLFCSNFFEFLSEYNLIENIFQKFIINDGNLKLEDSILYAASDSGSEEPNGSKDSNTSPSPSDSGGDSSPSNSGGDNKRKFEDVNENNNPYQNSENSDKGADGEPALKKTKIDEGSADDESSSEMDDSDSADPNPFSELND